MTYQRVGELVRELRTEGRAVDSSGTPVTSLRGLVDLLELRAEEIERSTGVRQPRISLTWLNDLENDREVTKSPEKLEALSRAFGLEPHFLLRVELGSVLSARLAEDSVDPDTAALYIGHRDMAERVHLPAEEDARRFRAVKAKTEALRAWPRFNDYVTVRNNILPLAEVLDPEVQSSEEAAFSPGMVTLAVELVMSDPFSPSVPAGATLSSELRTNALVRVFRSVNSPLVDELASTVGDEARVFGPIKVLGDPRPVAALRARDAEMPSEAACGSCPALWLGKSMAGGWYLTGMPGAPREWRDLSAEDADSATAAEAGGGSQTRAKWGRFWAPGGAAQPLVPPAVSLALLVMEWALRDDAKAGPVGEREFAPQELERYGPGADVLERLGPDLGATEVKKLVLVSNVHARLLAEGRIPAWRGDLPALVRSSLQGIDSVLALREEQLKASDTSTSPRLIAVRELRKGMVGVLKHLKDARVDA